MALTATATQGFELVRYTTQDEVLWVPGDPGDTLNKGAMVTFTVGEGIADICAANEVCYGVVMEKVVLPASSVAFPKLGTNDATNGWGGVLNDNTKTLLAIKPLIPCGVPIHRVTFADHKDETVISYSAASVYIAETTGHTADDYPNGALVYVYEGPGAGEWNVVDDYDHTGGAVELLLQLHRKFNATLTSASKFIVVTGEGASNKGVGFFGRTGVQTSTGIAIEVDDHADNGDLMVYLDARDASEYLSKLTLPVIKAGHMLLV